MGELEVREADRYFERFVFSKTTSCSTVELFGQRLRLEMDVPADLPVVFSETCQVPVCVLG